MEKKEPLESCNHIWKQTGFWDGADKDGNRVAEDGNYVGGPSAKCTECGGTRSFMWVEWKALPVEKRIELKSRKR